MGEWEKNFVWEIPPLICPWPWAIFRVSATWPNIYDPVTFCGRARARRHYGLTTSRHGPPPFPPFPPPPEKIIHTHTHTSRSCRLIHITSALSWSCSGKLTHRLICCQGIFFLQSKSMEPALRATPLSVIMSSPDQWLHLSRHVARFPWENRPRSSKQGSYGAETTHDIVQTDPVR